MATKPRRYQPAQAARARKAYWVKQGLTVIDATVDRRKRGLPVSLPTLNFVTKVAGR